jgi:hypothetical protein
VVACNVRVVSFGAGVDADIQTSLMSFLALLIEVAVGAPFEPSRLLLARGMEGLVSLVETLIATLTVL